MPAEPPPLSSRQQELWRLLLEVATAAHTALPSAAVSSLEHFFSSQQVTAALQAALCDFAAPAVQLHVINMIGYLAATTVGLARSCFEAFVPLAADLMQAIQQPDFAIGGDIHVIHVSSSRCSIAIAAGSDRRSRESRQQAGAMADAVPRALRAAWAMLLDRVNSQQLLEVEVSNTLDPVATVVLIRYVW